MNTWPPCRVRWGRAARVRRKTAVRFVPRIRSQASSVVSTRLAKPPTPALLTRICRPPWAATAASTARAQTAASVMSPGKATARAPPARTSRATDSISETVRATRVTLAPARPRARATARPIPRPAPVTRAEAPRTCMISASIGEGSGTGKLEGPAHGPYIRGTGGVQGLLQDPRSGEGCHREGDQGRLSQARAEAPSRHEPGQPQSGGPVQGDRRGLRGAVRSRETEALRRARGELELVPKRAPGGRRVARGRRGAGRLRRPGRRRGWLLGFLPDVLRRGGGLRVRGGEHGGPVRRPSQRRAGGGPDPRGSPPRGHANGAGGAGGVQAPRRGADPGRGSRGLPGPGGRRRGRGLGTPPGGRLPPCAHRPPPDVRAQGRRPPDERPGAPDDRGARGRGPGAHPGRAGGDQDPPRHRAGPDLPLARQGLAAARLGRGPR